MGYIFYRCFSLFIFLFFYLTVNFQEPVAQNLMDRSSPEFQDWYRQVKGLVQLIELFVIFQGTLPWQPIKVEKSSFFPDQSTLLRCHSEKDCNIAIPLSKGSIG